MHILLYVVMAAIVISLCVAAVLRRYIDVQTVRRYVRRAVIVVASLAFLVCVAAACLVCCYSSVTGYLKETLSANTIEELKTALKLMFDGGSAFSALQTLVISSLMFGFVSCTALGMSGLTFVLTCKIRERKGGVEREQRSEKPLYNNYVNRAFLVYERYNS